MASETATDGTPTNGANPWIDSLVAGGRWTDGDGGVVTIGYSLESGSDPNQGNHPQWDDGSFWGGVTWQSSDIAALTAAMALWEAVANVDFVEVTSGSADIWYWLTDDDGLGPYTLGLHEFPEPGTGTPNYGVFNYQGTGWTSAGLAQGGYGFVTLLHELGHALGLAHPHDGAAGIFSDGTVFPGVSSAFNDYGDYELNQGIWTTMSYNSGWPSQFPGHSDKAYGWEGTPMALDIAAVQLIYGANMTYHTGNDTYLLPHTNAAGAFWACIWDAGGTDTISAAGSSTSATIDLNAAPSRRRQCSRLCFVGIRTSSVVSPSPMAWSSRTPSAAPAPTP